jgi:carboxylesterase type B
VAPQLLQYDPSRTDVTAKIRDFYKLGFAQTLNYFQEFPKITKILSDRMYNAATSELGRIQSQFSPVYMYYYNYHGVWQFVSTFSAHSVSGEEREVIARSQALATWWKKNIVERNPPSFGVSHADELSLFFNYTGSVPIGPGSKDYEMSMALVSLWVQFANDE